MFTEVKMRTSFPVTIKSNIIQGYKDFWNVCILFLVVPDENVFYAQRISDLQIKDKYNPVTDFCGIREFFQDIDECEFQSYASGTAGYFVFCSPILLFHNYQRGINGIKFTSNSA
jgi:hypothetical protein